jgi:hypothetical protein
MVVALVATTLVAATPPIVTPVAVPKPVPVIVTVVPPDAEPEEGLTLVTVGADSKAIANVPKVELQPVVPVW